MGERLGSKGRINLTRALIILIGLYILYWGLAYKGKEDIWDYIKNNLIAYYNLPWKSSFIALEFVILKRKKTIEHILW